MNKKTNDLSGKYQEYFYFLCHYSIPDSGVSGDAFILLELELLYYSL